jgi:hypothetical protein
MNTETYTLPAHWASPLVNGDYSGCSLEDEQQINDWLADYPHLGSCLTCSDGDGEFLRYHDAPSSPGACMCLEFTFPVQEGT